MYRKLLVRNTKSDELCSSKSEREMVARMWILNLRELYSSPRAFHYVNLRKSLIALSLQNKSFLPTYPIETL